MGSSHIRSRHLPHDMQYPSLTTIIHDFLHKMALSFAYSNCILYRTVTAYITPWPPCPSAIALEHVHDSRIRYIHLPIICNEQRVGLRHLHT